jgi:hypothetical protein
VGSEMCIRDSMETGGWGGGMGCETVRRWGV